MTNIKAKAMGISCCHSRSSYEAGLTPISLIHYEYGTSTSNI